MRRALTRLFLVAILATGLVALSEGHIESLRPSPAVAAQSDDPELRAFVDELIEATDAYWRGLFQTAGWDYKRPIVSLPRSGQPETSECEGEASVDHSYCPADE